MKYLPITLIATLSASLVVALFFTPTLGALLGKAAPVAHDDRVRDNGPYMRTVKLALRHPGMTLALAAFLLVAVQTAYSKYGHGVEFFPKVEPDFGQVIVHGRGNLSIAEKDRALRAVCGRIQRKIKWTGGTVQTERFLREFYAALRARLEQKMLLGKRKKDKYARDE